MKPFFLYKNAGSTCKIDKNGKILPNSAPLNKKTIQRYTHLQKSIIHLNNDDLRTKLDFSGFNLNLDDEKEIALSKRHYITIRMPLKNQ